MKTKFMVPVLAGLSLLAGCSGVEVREDSAQCEGGIELFRSGGSTNLLVHRNTTRVSDDGYVSYGFLADNPESRYYRHERGAGREVGPEGVADAQRGLVNGFLDACESEGGNVSRLRNDEGFYQKFITPDSPSY